MAEPVFSHCGVWGGEGGDRFHDGQVGGRRIEKIKIRAGEYIDQIQVIWVDEISKEEIDDDHHRHGGPGGDLHEFEVPTGDFIIGVGGRVDDHLHWLTLRTYGGKVGNWGGSGGKRFSCDVPRGTRLHGFYGRAGKYVDAIGMIWVTE